MALLFDKSEFHEKHLPAWLIYPALVIFILSLATYIFVVQTHLKQLWSMFDLAVYIEASKAVISGHNLYINRFTSAQLPFTYPPIAALFFFIVSAVPMYVLKLCVFVINIIALIVSIWLAWGLLGYRYTPGRVGATLLIAGISLWLEPVQQSLLLGQINLILMAIIIADLCQPDKNLWKGVGIGLATAFKLTPAIFMLYLFLTRRFRATLIAVCVLLSTVLIGYVFLPEESAQFWGGLFVDAIRIGGVGFVGNQSLHGSLARLLHGTVLAQTPWLTASLVTGIVGLCFASWFGKRGDELYGIVISAFTGLLISPISWSHHWVWIVMLVIVVIHLAINRWPLLFWPVVVLLLVTFGAWFILGNQYLYNFPMGIIWTVPFSYSGYSELGWQGIQKFKGEMYVITGLIIVFIFPSLLLKCSIPKIKKRN